MDNIKNIVQSVIRSMSGQHTLNAQEAESIFRAQLKEDELKHVRLVGEKDRQLWVNVDSPAWLCQMNTRKPRILNDIRKEFPQIRGICFRLGNIH